MESIKKPKLEKEETWFHGHRKQKKPTKRLEVELFGIENVNGWTVHLELNKRVEGVWKGLPNSVLMLYAIFENSYFDDVYCRLFKNIFPLFNCGIIVYVVIIVFVIRKESLGRSH